VEFLKFIHKGQVYEYRVETYYPKCLLVAWRMCVTSLVVRLKESIFEPHLEQFREVQFQVEFKLNVGCITWIGEYSIVGL